MNCPTTSSSRRPDAAAWLAAARLYLDPTPRPTRTRSRALGLARAMDEGIPSSACTRSCPGSVRARQARPRPRILDGDIEAGPCGVPAGACREPPQPLRRRTCRRRSRRRARQRRGGGRAHARPRRRLRHRGLRRGLAASCSKPRNRIEPSSCSAAPAGKDPDAHPRRLEGVHPRAAHTLLAGAGSPQRGRARSRPCRGHGSGRAPSLATAWANRACRRGGSALRRHRPRYRTRTRLGRCSQSRSPNRERARALGAERSPRPARTTEP